MNNGSPSALVVGLIALGLLAGLIPNPFPLPEAANSEGVVEGTWVHLWDNSEKKIEDIKVGDLLKTQNTWMGMVQSITKAKPSKIIALQAKRGRDLEKFYGVAEPEDRILFSTPNHCFVKHKVEVDLTKSQWNKVSTLREGDQIQTAGWFPTEMKMGPGGWSTWEVINLWGEAEPVPKWVYTLKVIHPETGTDMGFVANGYAVHSAE